MHPKPLALATVVLATVLAGCNGAVVSGCEGFVAAPEVGQALPHASWKNAREGTNTPQANAPIEEAVAKYGTRPHVCVVTNRGSFELEIFLDQVPITAINFLELASTGFYDDTKFHRVIDDFMIQGGDPNSRDDGKVSQWGQGGPGWTIPDEFHPDLRHDAEGLLSMANSGPNTGGSQFFITLDPTPHLDDKHAIFGKVVSGMDVVKRIGATATNTGDRPLEAVVVQTVRVAEPTGTALPPPQAELVVLRSESSAAANGTGSWIILPTGGASPADGLSIEVDAPAGYAAHVELDYEDFALPAGQRFAVLVTAEVPAGTAPGDATLTARLMAGQTEVATAALELNVTEASGGKRAQSGSNVEANYIGLTVTGALFDSSILDVVNDERLDHHTPAFNRRPDASYGPFEFTVDGGVIQGFSDAVRGLAPGESGLVRIPPAQAYGESGSHALAGRALIFQIDVLSVN